MRRRAAVGLLLLALLAPCAAQDPFVEELRAQGRLGVSLAEATRLAGQIGQLLMVNVDGFGVSGKLAVSGGYLDLVEKVQVGGVIPHYGRTTPSTIRATNEALASLTRLPLFIASDIVTLRTEGSSGGAAAQASFGDGYVGGFIGRYRSLPDTAFAQLARVNAYMLRALGMNAALWPTVDASTRDDRVLGRATVLIAELKRARILATLKHWPLVPIGVDLHREAVDEHLSRDEVERLAAPFRALASRADLIMTTHFFDSEVDGSLVTLSPRWLELLRRDTKFRGPVLSDGLFMLRSHRIEAASAPALPGLGHTGDDEIAHWAATAILAGHDMVIVEGTAATSLHVYRRLLELSSRADDVGRRLRSRVSSAYRKIAELKRRRAAELGRSISFPAELVDRLIRFAADPVGGEARYAGLEAEMEHSLGVLEKGATR